MFLNMIEKKYKQVGDTVPYWSPAPMLQYLVKNHGNPAIQDWVGLYRQHNKHKLTNSNL